MVFGDRFELGKGDAEIDGVRIYDVGYVSGRVRRMLVTSRRVLKRALALDAQVYHLHIGIARDVATGLQFFPVTALALTNAFVRLGTLYAQPKIWKAMQRNAMKQPVGWETSAAAYHAIYVSLAKADH